MFKDVKPGRWDYGSIERVARAGLMSGYPDGTFRPDNHPTRGEIASILDRLMFRDGVFSDILPEVMPAVVTVYTDKSIGSGVCVGDDREKYYVLTCRHVVEGAKQFKVAKENGIMVNAELLTSSAVPGEDLALLAVRKTEGLALKDIGFATKPPTLGQPVAVIGAPLGMRESVTVGVVSNLDREGGNWFQLDAPINPGNSGGPIVNEYGSLVGIAVAKVVDEAVEGIGFGIHLRLINNFLSRLNLQKK